MTPIQEEYVREVKNGAYFRIKGITLISSRSMEKYPLAMAKAVGVKPKMLDMSETKNLEKKW